MLQIGLHSYIYLHTQRVSISLCSFVRLDICIRPQERHIIYGSGIYGYENQPRHISSFSATLLYVPKTTSAPFIQLWVFIVCRVVQVWKESLFVPRLCFGEQLLNSQIEKERREISHHYSSRVPFSRSHWHRHHPHVLMIYLSLRYFFIN